jgi:hypothetical protein
VGQSVRGKGTALEDLNSDQRAFALEWVKTRSPKAALAAGRYSVAGDASGRAKEMRKRCYEYIYALETDIKRTAMISVGSVQRELTYMAYSNPLDYHITDETTGETRPKRISELTREEGIAIQDFEQVWFGTEDHDPKKGFWVLANIKLVDKVKAFNLLCKTAGILVKDQGTRLPDGDGGGPVGHGMLNKLPTSDLQALEAILRKAAALVGKARDQNAIPVHSSEVLVAGTVKGTTVAAAAVTQTALVPAPRHPVTDKDTK